MKDFLWRTQTWLWIKKPGQFRNGRKLNDFKLDQEYSIQNKFEKKIVEILSIPIVYLNAQSVKNKKDELESYICQFEKLPIMIFCETWLKSCESNMLLPFANKYSIFRCDRMAGWGGLAILIPRTIPSVSVQSVQCFDYELLTCKITASKVTIAITVVYRPPRPHKK